MSVLILLIALILALMAGYFFCQWKCPSKKEKLEQIVENMELEEDLDFQEIKKLQADTQKELKKAKELAKKKAEELTAEESKTLANLPALQEMQALTQDIQKTEDWNKKVIGTWDYVLAGGIVVGVFLLSVWLVGKLFGLTKLDTAN